MTYNLTTAEDAGLPIYRRTWIGLYRYTVVLEADGRTPISVEVRIPRTDRWGVPTTPVMRGLRLDGPRARQAVEQVRNPR